MKCILFFMDMENICSRIFQNSFAQAMDLCCVIAYITIKVKKFPFNKEEFHVCFRKLVRNTPISNVDIEVIETEEVPDDIIILDSLESFSEGDTPPQVFPFHESINKIQL